MKKYHFDSSDDEREDSFIKRKSLTDLKSYLDYIVSTLKIDDLGIIGESKTFKLKLGLFLHNIADRVFRNSEIHQKYKELKDKLIGLDKESYDQWLGYIKTFFNEALKKADKEENKLLTKIELEDQDYINLLSCVFNKNIKIPDKIPKDLFSTDEDFRQSLLKELQQSEIKLSFLSNPSLSLVQSTSIKNSSEFLAFAHIANRNNKNTCKYLKQIKTDHSTNTSYTLPNTILKTFNDSHIIHYGSGNIQTKIMGLGKYENILKRIGAVEDKDKFITQMFNILKNEELDKNINPFSEQLTHLLFITELQRNTATLFSSPMFLNLIQKELKVDKYIFPMEEKGAIDYARLIVNYYQEELPNTYFMDLVKKVVDKNTLKPADNILIREGELLIQWLHDFMGNKILSRISHQLDFKTYAGLLIDKGNNISIYDIKKLVEDLSILIGYDAPYAKVVFKDANIEVTTSINTIEALLAEKRTDLEKLKLYQTKVLSHFKSQEVVLEELQKIFNWFKKSTEPLKELIKDFENNFKENIKTALQEATKILTGYLAIWYNIKIDLNKLFKLKGETEKIDSPDSSDQEDMQDLEEQKNSGKQLNKRTLEDIQSQEEKQDSSSQKIQKVDNTPREISKEPVEQKTINEGQTTTTALQGVGDYAEEKAISYISPFFGKYTLDALNYILTLRINDLQLKNIKILQGVFIDQKINNIPDIFTQALNSAEKIILVPLSLFNKHAVGLIFEKSKNNVIQVKYVDSLNQHIPQELKQLMSNISEDKVIFQEITVEQQKYANCGPEVIENFISCLIGDRLSQEKAIELHSRLIENVLVSTNFNLYSEFIEVDNKPHDIYYDNFQIDTIGEDHALV